MDPILTLHVGLIGTPALAPAEFVQRPKSFQMVGIVGTTIPIGTYDSSRAINLGTNRWSFRLGVGSVTPMGVVTTAELLKVPNADDETAQLAV